MYQFLTYPLDVIKTNRIVHSALTKEGVEHVPREFMALYDKGGLQHGALRGLSVTAAIAVAETMNPVENLVVTVPLITAV